MYKVTVKQQDAVGARFTYEFTIRQATDFHANFEFAAGRWVFIEDASGRIQYLNSKWVVSVLVEKLP